MTVEFQVGFDMPKQPPAMSLMGESETAMQILNDNIERLKNPIVSVITDNMLERNKDLYNYLTALPDGEYFRRMWALFQDFNLVMAENIAYKKQIDRVNKHKSELINQLMKLNLEKSTKGFGMPLKNLRRDF